MKELIEKLKIETAESAGVDISEINIEIYIHSERRGHEETKFIAEKLEKKLDIEKKYYTHLSSGWFKLHLEDNMNLTVFEADRKGGY